MGQLSVLSKNQYIVEKVNLAGNRDYNRGTYYKDLYGINKVLLLLKEHGDPSFLFQSIGKV